MMRAAAAALALAVASSADVVVDEGLQRHFDVIKAAIGEELGGDGSTSTDKCVVSDSNACALKDLDTTTSTVVYPGAGTRCIFSPEISGDYGFQVFPGDRSKLLLYFQGGGACWDKVSTVFPMCSTSASPSGSSGVFDRDDDRNPYQDWTIVQILYCSGDVHGGNVTRDYNDKLGNPVVQAGALNAQVTIDWILGQDDLQAVDELVIMGCSAGSIGAQLWSAQALEALKPTGYSKATVFPDSFVGVFSENVEGPLIRDFGYCNSLCPADLLSKCQAGELLFADIVSEQLSTAPSVPFAWLNSKADVVQQSYYMAVALSMYHSTNTTVFIDPSEYYYDVNERFEAYYSQHDNAVLYLVQSGQHCYTNNAFMYSADASSKRGGGYSPAVLDYMAAAASSSGLSGQCDGDVVPLSDRPDSGTEYCDQALDGRVI